jgi:hypothetical protein
MAASIMRRRVAATYREALPLSAGSVQDNQQDHADQDRTDAEQQGARLRLPSGM